MSDVLLKEAKLIQQAEIAGAVLITPTQVEALAQKFGPLMGAMGYGDLDDITRYAVVRQWLIGLMQDVLNAPVPVATSDTQVDGRERLSKLLEDEALDFRSRVAY